MNKKIMIAVAILFLVTGVVAIVLAAVLSTKTVVVRDSFSRQSNAEIQVLKPLSPVPRRIIQTHYDKALIPAKVFANISKYGSGYEHVVFDDAECLAFLSDYYEPCVGQCFTRLKGPYKADIFRYAYLYIYGCIYLDIKTELKCHVDEIFTDRTLFYASLTHFDGVSRNEIYQGVLSIPAGHPVLLKLIHKLVNTSEITFYTMVCEQMQAELVRWVGSPILVPGRNGKSDVYLLREEVTSRPNPAEADKYGLLSRLWDGDHIVINTRYRDYPWKKTAI